MSSLVLLGELHAGAVTTHPMPQGPRLEVPWPTPTASGGGVGRNATCVRPENTQHHSGRTLMDEVILLGAPARPIHYVSTESDSLNPTWVAQLMGFPSRWDEPQGPPRRPP